MPYGHPNICLTGITKIVFFDNLFEESYLFVLLAMQK